MESKLWSLWLCTTDDGTIVADLRTCENDSVEHLLSQERWSDSSALFQVLSTALDGSCWSWLARRQLQETLGATGDEASWKKPR